jgi:hypothetical protein
MTLPLPRAASFHKVMGINEKVAPKAIAWAYEALVSRGLLNLKNAVIVCGTDENVCPVQVTDDYTKDHTVLDEMTPGCTVLTFIQDGKYFGQMCVHPADFGLKIDWKDVWIPTDPDKIRAANALAIDPSQDTPLRHYLAMNSALGVLLEEDVSIAQEPEDLRDKLEKSYRQCLEVLADGTVKAFIEKYVAATRS